MFTMFTSLLVLSFVSFVARAAATCNSIELNGLVHPEHVCTATIDMGSDPMNTSYSYECYGEGGAIRKNYLNSPDCTGAVYSAQDPCGGDADCTYTAHCGGEVCTYAVIEQWQGVTQCNGDVPAPNAYTSYTKEGYVMDVCINSQYTRTKWTCSAQDGISMNYGYLPDCVGSAGVSSLIYGVGCDATVGSAGAVDCNAVAPIRSKAPTKPETGSPTVSSPEPTQNSTQEPTRATAGGDGDDDVKGRNQGEDLWLFVALSALVTCLVSAFCIVFYFRTKRKRMIEVEQAERNVAADVKQKAEEKADVDDLYVAKVKVNDGDNEDYKEEDVPHDSGENNTKLIRIWLNDTVGLTQYFATFIDNGYTSLDFISNISTKDDLNEIGITVKEHQAQIIAHIQKLKHEVEHDKDVELIEEEPMSQETEGVKSVNQNATDAPGLFTKTPSKQRNDTKHDSEQTVGEV